MGILKSIPDSIITLYSDYRSGTAKDFGPLGRDGTFPAGNVQFSIAGAHFQGTGRIVHPDHVGGRNTTGSVVLLGTFSTGVTGNRFFSIGPEATALRFMLRISGNYLQAYSTATGNSVTTTLFLGAKCFGVDYSSGVAPKCYRDGIFSSNGTVALTISAIDSIFTIASTSMGIISSYGSPIACVLETNRPLTASEHSQIFAELQEKKFPTRTYSIRSVDSSPNPNEPGLVWAPDLQHPANNGTVADLSPTSATATKVGVTEPSFSIDGVGAGRSFNGANGYTATGTSFTKVNDFTVCALVKMDIAAGVQMLIGQRNRWYIYFSAGTLRFGTVGIKTYTSTITLPAGKAHLVAVALDVDNNANFYVDGNFIQQITHNVPAAAGSGAFDVAQNNLINYHFGKIYRAEIYNRALTASEVANLFSKSGLKNIQTTSGFGTPVSTASRGGIAGGYLESTRFQFGTTTPRYTVDVSTIQGEVCKTLVCGTAGHLYQAQHSSFTAQQLAYGSWEWTWIKSAAGSMDFMLVASDKTAPGTAGNNGYFVRVDANEKVWLYKAAGVTLTPLLSTNNDYVVAGTAYTLRLTRTFSGVWTLWIRGLAATPGWTLVSNAGGGTNPTAADNTYTASPYMVLDFDATDRMSIGTREQDYSFAWSPFM